MRADYSMKFYTTVKQHNAHFLPRTAAPSDCLLFVRLMYLYLRYICITLLYHQVLFEKFYIITL